MSQTVTRLHFTPTQSGWQERLTHAWQRLRAGWRDAAARRRLGMLDDRMLSDIGVSRAQAQFVAEAPIWDFHR